MIPILYESDETEFTSAGLGGLTDCLSCEVREVLNGDYECTLEYPCNSPMFSKIKPGRIIYTTHDASREPEPFDIYAFSVNTNGVATFRASHVNYRLAKRVVMPSSDAYVVSPSLGDFLREIFYGYFNVSGGGNGWLFLNNPSNCSHFTFSVGAGVNTYFRLNMNHPASSRKLLLDSDYSVLSTIKCEFEWKRFEVKLLKRRGSDKTAIIRFSHNLKAMTYDCDYNNAGTEVIPYWRGKLYEIDRSGNPFTWDYDTWYVLDGNTADSSGGKLVPTASTYSNYFYPPAFTGNYVSFPNHKPKNGDYKAVAADITHMFEGIKEGTPSAEDFISAAESFASANNSSEPLESISIDLETIWDGEGHEYVSDAEGLVIGDTATIVYPEIGFSKRMRVVSATWDCLLDRYKQMEFGVPSQDIYTVDKYSGTQAVATTPRVTISDE